ncbi:protein phosphatase EYA3-like [Maylandia zebra]|uniref:protein phosphatase EYA3-like n=1 Tax=Maylandia zebra TaxID=106582 RepID=UPI00403C2A12
MDDSQELPLQVRQEKALQRYDDTESEISQLLSFPQTGQTYGLPPFGAMWPGIKTETGLPDAPSGGQPGFLSFSSTYTSTQPGQLHYSYPSQGSSFTTSSVYSNIPSATAATTTASAVAHQHFSSYNSLGQSQFSQYYTLPPSYVPAGLPNSDDHSGGAGVAGYSAVKSEEAASAGLPPRDASPPENLPVCAALPTAVAVPAGARDQDEVGRKNSVGTTEFLPTEFLQERIFLWDLDETIIIFHSLLTGSYAQKFGKDPATVLNLGLQMEELIFELADTHLFFNDLEVQPGHQVTTTQLVPALAKVLLYGLGDVFPIENIYSATKIGKESCFERIVSRFGKKVTYVVIGDGRDEEFSAKQHNMPFWRISSHGDLVSLHQALELDFL